LDSGVDEVDLFSYGVGNTVRAWGRGGGALGEGEFDFFLSKGGGRGVILQATPAGQGVLRGEEVVQKRTVDCDWVRGVGEGGAPGGLSCGDQLFGPPDVVSRGFCKKVSPIGGLCSFDGLEVAELRLSCYAVGIGGLGLFGPSGGFREFLLESG